jgi:hypothetical protein
VDCCCNFAIVEHREKTTCKTDGMNPSPNREKSKTRYFLKSPVATCDWFMILPDRVYMAQER